MMSSSLRRWATRGAEVLCGSKGPGQPPGQTCVHHLATRVLLYLQAPQSHGDPSPILRVDQALPSNSTSFVPSPSFHSAGGAAAFVSPGSIRKSSDIGQHLLDLARALGLAEDLWCWKEPPVKHSSTCPSLSHEGRSPTA